MVGGFWLACFAAASVACRAPSAMPSDGAPSAGAHPRASATPRPMLVTPSPVPVVPVTPPVVPVAPADRLHHYPATPTPLVAPCKDPRVVLAVHRSGDPTGALWVQ